MFSRRPGHRFNRGRIPAGRFIDKTPLRLSTTAVLWLRGDLGITTVSSKVSAWADQSGSGNHLVQGIDANRPTLSAAINGQQCVDFSGGSHWLDSAELNTYAQPLTIAVVLRPTALATGIALDSNDATDFVSLAQISGGSWILTAGTNRTFGAYSANNNYYVLGIVNGASSKGRVNGSETALLTPGANSMKDFTVGSAQAQANYANAHVAEVVVYSGALSAQDITTLEAYFAARYAI